MAERYYMNKMFGRGMERARQLAEEARGAEQPGGLKRVTIEPDETGGHHVVVERETLVESGREPEPGESGTSERSEHSFARPEDLTQFLQDVLAGHEPGAQSDEDEPNAEDSEATPSSSWREA